MIGLDSPSAAQRVRLVPPQLYASGSQALQTGVPPATGRSALQTGYTPEHERNGFHILRVESQLRSVLSSGEHDHSPAGPPHIGGSQRPVAAEHSSGVAQWSLGSQSPPLQTSKL